MTYTPVIFEHPQYGTLVVAGMIDVDNQTTNDIEQAMLVVCPLPDGNWLHACSSEGRLTRIERLH